jgi:hypothetical protein
MVVACRGQDLGRRIASCPHNDFHWDTGAWRRQSQAFKLG